MIVRLLIAVAALLAIASSLAGCSIPGQESASSTPAGPKLPPIAQITGHIASMSVPPFHAEFRRVRCGYMKDTLVLCSGIVSSTLTGQRSDRVNVLFRFDPTLDPPLRAVCSQGHYAIQPTFNIFCAD